MLLSCEIVKNMGMGVLEAATWTSAKGNVACGGRLSQCHGRV